MINRIEEISNLEEFGEDLVHFHVFFQNEVGNEVKMPWMISFWNLLKFIKSHDPDASDYISKVSSGIRSYGSKDSKVLQILNSEGFPVLEFVKKYMDSFPVEKIQEHIDWSENLVLTSSFIEKKNELDHLIPSMRSNNARRSLFSQALDDAIQQEVNNFYPEFFDEITGDSYLKYEKILSDIVVKTVSNLEDFFYKESQK